MDLTIVIGVGMLWHYHDSIQSCRLFTTISQTLLTRVVSKVIIETDYIFNFIGHINFCRIYPKAAEVPTQLTIFYDGTVNVFDGISPEKVLNLSLSLSRAVIIFSI